MNLRRFSTFDLEIGIRENDDNFQFTSKVKNKQTNRENSCFEF